MSTPRLVEIELDQAVNTIEPIKARSWGRDCKFDPKSLIKSSSVNLLSCAQRDVSHIRICLNSRCKTVSSTCKNNRNRVRNVVRMNRLIDTSCVCRQRKSTNQINHVER